MLKNSEGRNGCDLLKGVAPLANRDSNSFQASGLLLALLLAALPSLSLEAAASYEQASSTQTLIIDGSKNPERFPQWYVWETAFRSLPTSQLEPLAQARLLTDLGVSEADLVLIAREASHYRRAETALSKSLRATLGSLKAAAASEQQIREATRPLNLTYRHEILDARTRLHLALSADSRLGLTAWIDRILSRTTLRLSGDTLKYFHEPW